MGKRVQTGVRVPTVELELPDGRVYTFAMDMDALALLEDKYQEIGGVFQYLSELKERLYHKPVTTFTEVLYVGLKARHPELTTSDVRRMFPANIAALEAISEAMAAILPEGSEPDPTIPALILEE